MVGILCCIQQPQVPGFYPGSLPVVTVGRTTGLIEVCKKKNPLSDTRSMTPAFPILLTFSSCLSKLLNLGAQLHTQLGALLWLLNAERRGVKLYLGSSLNKQQQMTAK